jgi:hypothetical protein
MGRRAGAAKLFLCAVCAHVCGFACVFLLPVCELRVAFACAWLGACASRWANAPAQVVPLPLLVALSSPALVVGCLRVGGWAARAAPAAAGLALRRLVRVFKYCGLRLGGGQTGSSCPPASLRSLNLFFKY